MEFQPTRLISAVLWSLLISLQSTLATTYYNVSLIATSSAQYLTSPGYPTEYPNNLTYEWVITSSIASELVKIEVDDCEIEYISAKIPFCQLDELTVFDGAYDNSSVLYQSCCMTSVPAMNSSGPNLMIRFITDTTVVARGFRIKYYNTAYVEDSVAAASGIYIAIGVIILVIILVIVVVAFYIYKLKKSKEHSHRVNPVGGEEPHTSAKEEIYKESPKEVIDEYNKPPLPADSPAPPPNDWSEEEGMAAPESLGPKPDLINDQNLPDSSTRGNKLPPIQQVKTAK